MSAPNKWRRNPYAYPGGQARLNMGHPAVNQSLRLAAVATASGAMTDLLTSATRTNTSVGGEINGLGPTVFPAAANSSDYISFPALIPSETVNGLTMAAIFQPRGSTGGQGIVNINSSTGGGISVTASGLLGFGVNPNAFSSSNMPTCVPGHSYFAAYTFRSGGSNTNRYGGVAVDMTTGQMWAAQVNGATISPTTGTSYSAITYNGGTQDHARVAAVSITLSQLTFPQLLAWAKDPWSLWYPNSVWSAMQTQRTVAAGAGASNARVMSEVKGNASVSGTLQLFG